jgi:hypothetical protein
MKASLITGLLAVAGANCKPTSHIESETVNVENLRTVPQGWSAVGAPAGHRKLPFRIAVRSVRRVFMLIMISWIPTIEASHVGKVAQCCRVLTFYRPTTTS